MKFTYALLVALVATLSLAGTADAAHRAPNDKGAPTHSSTTVDCSTQHGRWSGRICQ